MKKYVKILLISCLSVASNVLYASSESYENSDSRSYYSYYSEDSSDDSKINPAEQFLEKLNLLQNNNNLTTLITAERFQYSSDTSSIRKTFENIPSLLQQSIASYALEKMPSIEDKNNYWNTKTFLEEFEKDIKNYSVGTDQISLDHEKGIAAIIGQIKDLKIAQLSSAFYVEDLGDIVELLKMEQDLSCKRERFKYLAEHARTGLQTGEVIIGCIKSFMMQAKSKVEFSQGVTHINNFLVPDSLHGLSDDRMLIFKDVMVIQGLNQTQSLSILKKYQKALGDEGVEPGTILCVQQLIQKLEAGGSFEFYMSENFSNLFKAVSSLDYGERDAVVQRIIDANLNKDFSHVLLKGLAGIKAYGELVDDILTVVQKGINNEKELLSVIQHINSLSYRSYIIKNIPDGMSAKQIITLLNGLAAIEKEKQKPVFNAFLKLATKESPDSEIASLIDDLSQFTPHILESTLQPLFTGLTEDRITVKQCKLIINQVKDITVFNFTDFIREYICKYVPMLITKDSQDTDIIRLITTLKMFKEKILKADDTIQCLSSGLSKDRITLSQCISIIELLGTGYFWRTREVSIVSCLLQLMTKNSTKIEIADIIQKLKNLKMPEENRNKIVADLIKHTSIKHCIYIIGLLDKKKIIHHQSLSLEVGLRVLNQPTLMQSVIKISELEHAEMMDCVAFLASIVNRNMSNSEIKNVFEIFCNLKKLRKDAVAFEALKNMRVCLNGMPKEYRFTTLKYVGKLIFEEKWSLDQGKTFIQDVSKIFKQAGIDKQQVEKYTRILFDLTSNRKVSDIVTLLSEIETNHITQQQIFDSLDKLVKPKG